MRILTLSLALGALTACGASLEDDFEADLTVHGGCGDVFVFAHDEADTMLLTAHAEGLIAPAQAAGEEVVTTFEIPDSGLTLELEVGQRISDAICDDVIENGGPQVDETWTAISGTATFAVRPDENTAEYGRADLHLEDVVLENDGGESVTIETFDVTDISVGWLAG
jgi:hypothetical protein